MYLTEDQLKELGLKSFGTNVKISDKTSIYNPENISIGNNIRIDDFCVISAGDGGIEMGNNIHISCFVSIIGAGKVTLENYVGLSTKVSIISSSDDFGGEFLTGPTIPDKYINVKHAPVTIKEHCVLGSGTVVLPGVTIGKCSATGAMTLVNKDVKDFSIVAGAPARFLWRRSRKLLEKQLEYEKNG
jgi:galactoside O-acetyltransferase